LKVQAVFNIKNLDYEQTYQRLRENASDARVNLTQKGLIEAQFHGKRDTVMLISRKGTIQILFNYFGPFRREPAKTRRFLKRIQKFLVAVPNLELRIEEMRVLKYENIRIISDGESEVLLSGITDTLDRNCFTCGMNDNEES
jgi:hypothetical protein